VALRSRDDVSLCRECVGWLEGQLGVTTTPTLPVVNMDEAIVFYERAGFTIHRWMDGNEPGGFAFADYDDVSVFDLGEERDMDPGTNRAACYLVTKDADAWHARMSKAGLPVTEMADQPWGMREFTLNDPSGNNIRIGRRSDERSPVDSGASHDG
jgi:uncharacterized glyoxalase superfamily protein PhnB